MIYHVQASIAGLLRNNTNRKLENLFPDFDGTGSEIRKHLRGKLKKGEKLLGSEGCEGFDPVTGCPGHED